MNNLLQNCSDLYNEFYKINNNKHNIGYNESIRKMFNLVDGSVDVNYYKSNCIELQGSIDKYDINKILLFDSIDEHFEDLIKDILWDYYLSNNGSDFDDELEFINSIKEADCV